MEVFCGIDWAEDHHDIALVDREGLLLARQRIGDDAAGLTTLLAVLADHGDNAEDPIPVAIETPRAADRLPARHRPTGLPDQPGYRDRHSVGGRKSDHGDAVVLASILRTDAHSHRPLPADSELAQAIAVLARAQQDAVWARTTAHNKLRSHLREYYPGFLAAFADARGGITRPEARISLAAAPDPAAAAKLTKPSSRRCSSAPGAPVASPPRPRGSVTHCARRKCPNCFSSSRPWVARRSPARSTQCRLRRRRRARACRHRSVRPARRRRDHHQLPRARPTHRRPSTRRDRRRPIPVPRTQRPQGLRRRRTGHPRRRQDHHRRPPPGQEQLAQRCRIHLGLLRSHRLTRARAHYDRRRQAKDRHAAAQRNLFARLLGCLHYCLASGQHYDEQPTKNRTLAA